MSEAYKTFVIATDGACSGNPGPGGWGVVFYDKSEGTFDTFGGLETETTNNRMELMAILNCYQIIMQKFIAAFNKNASAATRFKFCVMSDSSYVVSAINCGNMAKWRNNDWKLRSGKQVKNLDLWEKLSEILDCISLLKDKGPKVSIKLVKGHSGNHMNELADKQAVVYREMAIVLRNRKQGVH